MKVRFDVNDEALRSGFLKDTLIAALRPLTNDRQPLWGKMTAQQMVEHLLWAFEGSTGRVEIECRVPEERRQATKGFLFDNRPTPQEFMNPLLRAGLPEMRFSSLDDAIFALQAEVTRYLDHARSEPGAMHTHPFFGPITVEEWSRTHFKHAVHHLLQFALIEIEP
jgi:oxepin-CoA hydrolase / 3-oxo-5,6-dehydrosuberyl-CoA semialdehyde dehydrogenase